MPGASADSIDDAAQRGVQPARGDLDLGQLGHAPMLVLRRVAPGASEDAEDGVDHARVELQARAGPQPAQRLAAG